MAVQYLVMWLRLYHLTGIIHLMAVQLVSGYVPLSDILQIYEFLFNFDMNIAQFYINILRQKHQIELILVAINPKTFRLHQSAYTPFHFTSTVTLKQLFSVEVQRSVLNKCECLH